jgi:hypothetical protein
LADEIPGHRATDLEMEDAWRAHFERIDPSGNE